MTNKEEIFLSLSYWVASLDGNVDVSETTNISESEFRKLFKGSAVKRTKYSGLSRNINTNR